MSVLNLPVSLSGHTVRHPAQSYFRVCIRIRRPPCRDFLSPSARLILLSLSGTQTGSGNPTKTTADLPALVVSWDIPVIVQQSKELKHNNGDVQQGKDLKCYFSKCLFYTFLGDYIP